MIASLLDDIYLGMNPRPICELAITVEAAHRGVPVAEPMGAVVDARTMTLSGRVFTAARPRAVAVAVSCWG